ncbi:MAG: Crp/Fnr family transcriptional regulator [Deltaproteobacteria bacterium]|nr:Crp/Fnr family transcriptional regulator [Deltaproteobacteria bacterium]
MRAGGGPDHDHARIPTGTATEIEQTVRASFPFFDRLSSAARERVLESSQLRRYPRGALVIAENAKCPALLLVRRGQLRVYKSSEGGREITLYRVWPGDTCLISMSAVLSGSAYPAQVDAPADAEVLAVPAAIFRELFAAEEAVQALVIEGLSSVVSSMMALVAEVAFRRMDERLAQFLLGTTERGGPTVELSHEEVAAQLGTAREVVTRLLENLKDDGAILLERRRIRVLDRARLAQIAGVDAAR